MNPGTSIQEFEATFPDELSCAQFMLQKQCVHWKCICNRQAPWKISTQRLREARHSCGRSKGITATSVLHHSTFPLRDVFYTFLLYANNHEGIPSTFLQSHLGLGPSSSSSLARKVRLQMALLERDRTIGGLGQTVRIESRLIGRIRTKARKGKGRARLLLVSDANAVSACVIAASERRQIAPFLRKAIAPGSLIVTSDFKLKAALVANGRYKDFDGLEVKGTFSDFYKSKSYRYFRYLNRCLGRTYRSVDRDNLWLYVKEFQFRFNRMTSESSLFWELIDTFPAADSATIKSLHADANFSRVTCSSEM